MSSEVVNIIDNGALGSFAQTDTLDLLMANNRKLIITRQILDEALSPGLGGNLSSNKIALFSNEATAAAVRQAIQDGNSLYLDAGWAGSQHNGSHPGLDAFLKEKIADIYATYKTGIEGSDRARVSLRQ